MSQKAKETNHISTISTGKSRFKRQSSFVIGGLSLQLKTPRSSRGSRGKTPVGGQSRNDAANKVSSQKKNDKPEYDRDAEKQFERMLEGKMENIPHLPRSVVRIFISSTFSDMHAERDTLSREVFPKLQKFFAGLNLDFQVVDMRWGVTEDSQNDHSVEKICLQEVQNCQKMSLGANFVAIIGDRYGFRPIPTEMDVKMFEMLRAIAKDKDPNGSKLMDVWYQLDENSAPPQYVLQPIRSQFPFFGDYSPGCDEPRAKDTSNWQKTFNELQSVLREAAVTATNSKKLTKEQLHEFFLSVTELEIRSGILEAQVPGSHVAVFYREINGFGDLSDPKKSRYVDCQVKDGKHVFNEDVRKLQDSLKLKVQDVVNASHVHRYIVKWKDGGINVKHPDHKEYLEKFCDDFCNSLIDITEKAIEHRESRIRQSEYYSDYQEILHHLEFCQMKCETFCGREDVLERAKKYIMDAADRKPLVLHAPSGAGKTAVMAMIMKSLSSWFGKTKYIGIIRFLGTSPLTTNIYDVLKSVCGQLADAANIIMEPVGYKNMKNLLEYLPRFLRRVAGALKYPIVILLDSLDQLSKANDAYSLDWLATILPPNMKFLVSTLPSEHSILDTIQEILKDKSSFVEVPVFPPQSGRDMMDKYLKRKNRTLTMEQQRLLMTAFAKAPGPLFLKLMLDEAAQWNSYTPQHHLVLQESVQGAINQLFDNLEKKFGAVITGRALGYITVCKNGISENELEDVLSCDDEALDDVYRYHNPPVEGIVRIPPVIAARIRYDIREYLVERVSQEKYTMNWYHRQFIETAKTRYATGKDGQILHKNLCEIFMAEDGVRRDITLTRRKIAIPNADRQVTPQPVTASNKRMLTCLPYHVIHAGNELAENIVKEKCFYYFDFVKAKLAAYPVDVFLDELNEYLDLNEDEEIQMLRYFLSVSKIDFTIATKLAVSMLASISFDDNHIYMKSLLDQARKFLVYKKSNVLIPVFPCLAPRRDTSSALTDTYERVSSIASECVDAVLVETIGTTEENEEIECYKLFRTTTCEFEEVPIPLETNPKLSPVLDKGGKTLVYGGKESLNLLTLSNKLVTTRTYDELSSDKESKKLVALIQSSDTSHVVLQFDNGDLSLVEVSGLKPVRTWTLLEEEDDIAGILCTSTDNLKVLVAVGSVVDNSSGKFRIFKAEQDNDITVNIDKPFTKGMLGMASSEQLIAYVSNMESSSSVVVLGAENNLVLNDIAISEVVQHLSLARTKPLAAIMTGSGEVAILHLRSGSCLHKLSTNNPVTEMGIYWLHSLAMLGDNQGQINLFNTESGKYCGGFPAHKEAVKEIRILDDYMLSIGEDKELRIWSLPELVEGTKEKNQMQKESSCDVSLLAQKEIISFDMYPNGQVLVTASQDKILRLWSVKNAKYKGELDLGIAASKVLVSACDICIALDSSIGELKLIDLKSFNTVSIGIPANVLDFTLNKDLTMAYTISKKDRLLYITEVDLSLRVVKKSFPLKPGLQFETLGISLSDSERYLVISSKVLPKEFKEIQASWKKQGSFLPQVHPNRFTAVDLQQATGGLVQCLRNLSKIPTLGEVTHANIGNIMVITTRRTVLFWDIPTGKCDQRVCKNRDYGMMYRPCWLGQSCKGTSKVLLQSKDGQSMAVGSEDGYLFIYDVHSGFPIGEKKPSTKHSAPVIAAAFAPDCCWVASSCENNVIKLWDAQTAAEVFSTRVGSEIRRMVFSSDSKHLVALCGTHITRMLIYKLHTGTAD